MYLGNTSVSFQTWLSETGRGQIGGVGVEDTARTSKIPLPSTSRLIGQFSQTRNEHKHTRRFARVRMKALAARDKDEN